MTDDCGGREVRVFAGAFAFSLVMSLAVGLSACGPLSRQTEGREYASRELAGLLADPELHEVVSSYVEETREWEESEYRVEARGYRGAYNVAWVIHRDDEERVTPGGGQSFEVVVDMKELRVTRELAFQ